jgi:glycerol-3-phosphate cytidylyltransferase
VQDNDYILEFKPDAKIRYSTAERIEMLEGLRIVDEVVVYDMVCAAALEKIDFDILAIGEDQIGKRFDEAAQWCSAHGKQVVRLKRTPGICSSDIKKELGDHTTEANSHEGKFYYWRSRWNGNIRDHKSFSTVRRAFSGRKRVGEAAHPHR